MSEGSLPTTWKEAIPVVIGGVIVLGFGLEAVNAFTHGEVLRTLVSVVGSPR